MPLYSYEDPETGVHVELRRPVKDRDKPIILHRGKTVPDRLAVLLPGPTPDQSFNAKIRRQFYKREETQGSRFSGSEGLTKRQLAELWKDKPKETVHRKE